MASPAFPETATYVPATGTDRLEAILKALSDHRVAWANCAIDVRLSLLDRCRESLLGEAATWVDATTKHLGKGTLDPGEEWIGGPMVVLRHMRLLARALKERGSPRPRRLTQRADGQWVATVFPSNWIDHALYTGFRGEVWILPKMPPSQGRIYREGHREARLGLVLGAGNLGCIGPTDALHKLFVDNQVVVLKMNPVNEFLGPIFERAFKPLIDAGFLAIVYGGAEVGRFLTRHPSVQAIHMTGSGRTHDAIVWGDTDEEQARNKAAGTPVCDKPVTSELGSVSPIFVVPGPWSTADLRYQAEHVAAMVAHNASFNCAAGKVLVTAKGWPLRERFLQEVHDALRRAPPRFAYYPGAAARYEEFLHHYPDAIALGADGEGVVPWTALPDVPLRPGEYALCNEAFCGVLAEVDIDASDPGEFLQKAASAADECIWGTLTCVALVHPKTQKRFATELDEFIAQLRYGAIGVNIWSGAVFGIGDVSWGAFPGHTAQDIGSGRGTVHNMCLFDHPQKSVVYAPFRIRPTPVWFASHPNLAAVGPPLARLEAQPNGRHLASVLATAIRAVTLGAGSK